MQTAGLSNRRIMLALIIIILTIAAAGRRADASSDDAITLVSSETIAGDINHFGPPPPPPVNTDVQNYNLFFIDSSKYATYTLPLSDYSIQRITSSNPSVATASCSGNNQKIKVTAKKSGVTTLRIYYRYRNTSYVYSCKFEAVKSSQIFQKIVVAGQSLKYNAKKYAYRVRLSGSKASVKVSLRSGWVIQSISAYYENEDNTISLSKKYKNGSSFPIKNYYATSITVTVLHKKSGYTYSRDIVLFNGTYTP